MQSFVCTMKDKIIIKGQLDKKNLVLENMTWMQ